MFSTSRYDARSAAQANAFANQGRQKVSRDRRSAAQDRAFANQGHNNVTSSTIHVGASSNYSNPVRHQNHGSNIHVAPAAVRTGLFSNPFSYNPFRTSVPQPTVILNRNPQPRVIIQGNSPSRRISRIEFIFSSIIIGSFLGAFAGAIIVPHPASIFIGAMAGAMAGGLLALKV